MRGAAIDLGSNSFICYIYECTDGVIKDLDDKVILTRMSEGVDKTKVLAPQALKRAEDAFGEFSQLFKKYNVTNIHAVATSAVRDAKNQSEFLNIAKKFKIPVQILSGEEEANLTFKGVKDYFGNKNGMIIDIGGGSTEFVQVQEGQIKDRVSLNMGVVRFTERYLPNVSEFKFKEDEIRQGIRKLLETNEKLKSFLNFNFKTFLAVSGTPTNVASVLEKGFDSEKLDGYLLTHNNLNYFIEIFGELSLDERLEKYPFIEPKRADVLPTGVLILDEALNFFKFKNFTVSTRGIRHGLARAICDNVNSSSFKN